jgi:hypothetical protein
MAYDRADGALVGRRGVSLARVGGADRYEVRWTVRAVMERLGMRYVRDFPVRGDSFALYETSGGPAST